MNNVPKVSIIVTNYNNVKDTLECLDSIKATTYNNYEIIVVDDGSTDNSAQALRNREGICFIESGKNNGFVRANNIGIEHSAGDMICLLNNDTVVDGQWLTELVNTVLSDEKIAAAYPFFIDYGTPKHKMWPTPSVLKILKNTTYNLIGYPIPNVFDDYITTYLNASGCCLIFRKNIFDRYSDNDYFLYYDDIYFCWRLLLNGYKLKRSPYAVVYHKGSNTATGIKRLRSRSRYLCDRNRIMTLLIFYQAKTLIRIFPVLLADEIKKIMLMPFRLFYDPGYISVIISARLWLLSNIFKIYKKRKFIQSERKIPDECIIKGLTYKVTGSSNFLVGIFNIPFLVYARIVGLKTYEIIKK